MTPIIIFFGPRFKFFSLTLVHKMATRRTESKLHDLNAITTGKLVLATAQVYVIVETNTKTPQINEFLSGIAIRLGRVLLYKFPIIHVTKVGKKTNIALSGNTSCAPVCTLVYGSTILDKNKVTDIHE